MMKQHISALPDEILRRQELTEPMSFIFSTRSYYRCQKRNLQYCDLPFLWAWEDFLWPYLVITNKDKQLLLPLVLRCLTDSILTDYGALFAATAISIIPVLLIYLFFQKQFIAGIVNEGKGMMTYR